MSLKFAETVSCSFHVDISARFLNFPKDIGNRGYDIRRGRIINSLQLKIRSI
jgi:hypothetical protein